MLESMLDIYHAARIDDITTDCERRSLLAHVCAAAGGE